MLAQEKQQQDKNPFETSILQGDQIPIIMLEITALNLSENRYGSGDSRQGESGSSLHDCQFVFELFQPPEA